MRKPVAALMVLGACGSPSATLAPASVVAEDVRISSVSAYDGSVYWTVSPGGESNHAGRLMRAPLTGASEPVPLASGLFNPERIAVGLPGIVWVNHGDMVSCSQVQMLRWENSQPVDTTPELSTCRYFPVAVRDARLTLAALPFENPTVSMVLNVPVVDGPTEYIDTLGGYVVDAVAVGETSLVLVQHGDSVADGASVFRVAEDARQISLLVSGIRRTDRIVADNELVYWLDWNYPGQKPQLYRMPATGGDPELLWEYDGTMGIRLATVAGDDVWLVGGELLADGRWEQSLLKLHAARGLEQFSIDYAPQLIDSVSDDGLIIVTAEEAPEGRSEIVFQPLHLQE